MIDIVVISYAANEELKKQTQDCLKSLFKSERNSKQIFSVFVVESQEGVNWDYFPNTKTYTPPQPYGYHKFLNFGRKLGKNKFVCLCNNDLIFHDKWASNIIKASQDHPEAFSFSPICPKTQPIYGIFPETGNIPGYEIRKQISGWCIFQRRDIYEIIGDLDERFSHWFCDNDYALTLYKKQIPHYLITSSIVEHHDKNVGKTGPAVLTNEKMYEYTTGSQKIFADKWAELF